jgi:hypothetical protein
MPKIPLERTIESAYRFAFTNFFSVLGVIWLPLVAVCTLVLGLLYLTWMDMANLHALHVYFEDMKSQSVDVTLSAHQVQMLATAIGGALRFAGLIGLVVLIARAMVTVGVLRKALGLHEGPIFVYFSLGAPLWRMIGAMVLAILVVIGVVVATCIAAGILVAAAGYAPYSVRGLLRGGIVVAAALWVIYMVFRLVFFLPAVVVAEDRIGLGRAWELGRGNFWRIIAVLIAVLLPIGIVSGIISAALFGAMWWNQIEATVFSGHPVPPDVLFGMFLRDLRNIWPIWVAYQLIYITLLTGLFLGAIAAAYKGITTSEATA